MSAVVAAIVTGGMAVIGLGAAYMSAEAQKEAANKAVEAEERMADKSLAFQAETAERSRADVKPWRDSGVKALTQLQEGVASGDFGMSDMPAFDASQVDVTQDPGYAFRMSQGVDALDASASARGRLLSGAQRKALIGYGQEMGSQEYGNAYARSRNEYDDAYARESNDKLRRFNILSSMAGSGQVASNTNVGTNRNLANQSTNIMGNLGRAQARGEYLKGNARSGAYTDSARVVNQAAENWLTIGGSR